MNKKEMIFDLLIFWYYLHNFPFWNCFEIVREQYIFPDM